MTDNIKILTHKNQKVVFVDLSKLNEEQILATHPAIKETMISSKIRLLLLDTTNTSTTPKIRDSSKVITIQIEAKIGKTLTSIVGLRPLQKIIANAIIKDIYFARDIEAGLNWLTENSAKLV